MTVITRFAPSPTGFLHIGGARTALFNWLFAKRHGGKFLLRIEDTDKERSTQPAIDAIQNGLKWLGLEWDGEVVFQSRRENRHAEVAHKLLEVGAAYKCYCSQEELAQMREEAQKQNKPFRYDGRWRDRGESEAPSGVKPTIRLKTPLTGETIVDDKVQGRVVFPNTELDDLILLRSDGTPTYMLAVVVDDHDMGITHIIRGDDHLNNAAKQQVIYEALGWNVPSFSHIPLIHGADGAKLSKRHGALGVEAYRDMGYLPEAMRNYLLRLGWSHGNDEVISTAQAIEWFDLEHIGKSPARFDFDKLNNLNGIYMRETDDLRLFDLIKDKIQNPSAEGLERIKRGMKGLKERAKNLNELATSAQFYIQRLPFTDKAKDILDKGGKDIVAKVIPALETVQDWKHDPIQDVVKAFAEKEGLKLGAVAQPLRAALVGDVISPSIFEVMEVLGKPESASRLKSL